MKKEPLTVKQIQALDSIAIKKYGVASLTLMENAGRAVAEEVLKDLKEKRDARVCVFCGRGNNAGDGLVAARHLLNACISTEIFLIGRAENLKNDAAVNYLILETGGIAIKEIQKADEALKEKIARADVIVDAVFGAGLNREVREPFRGIIEAINTLKQRTISIDIPSGLDGTTGNIYGACIHADKTVTLSFLKRGFFKRDGPRHTGKIVVVDIGIPKELMKKT